MKKFTAILRPAVSCWGIYVHDETVPRIVMTRRPTIKDVVQVKDYWNDTPVVEPITILRGPSVKENLKLPGTPAEQKRFKVALKKVLSVSKEELDRRIKADNAARQKAYKTGAVMKPGPKRKAK